MHIFRPWPKHLQSLKRISIKLCEDLHTDVPSAYLSGAAVLSGNAGLTRVAYLVGATRLTG